MIDEQTQESGSEGEDDKEDDKEDGEEEEDGSEEDEEDSEEDEDSEVSPVHRKREWTFNYKRIFSQKILSFKYNHR